MVSCSGEEAGRRASWPAVTKWDVRSRGAKWCKRYDLHRPKELIQCCCMWGCIAVAVVISGMLGVFAERVVVVVDLVACRWFAPPEDRARSSVG